MNVPDRDESVGSELRRRASPKFAAQQRRSVLIGSLIVIAGGVFTLVDGIHGMQSGELVRIGGWRTGFAAPWWFAVTLGVLGIALGAWGAWPVPKRS